MKIAQIAPPIEAVPPKKYGGTERVVSTLTEELVRRGHEVTLFASGDSETSANLVSACPIGLREAFPDDCMKRVLHSQLHVGQAYAMQSEFDVIHDHTSLFGAGLANLSSTPVLMTLHGAINEIGKKHFTLFQNPSLVPISNAQKSFAPGLNYTDTIYNGINFDGYPYGEKAEPFLLFVGRICPEKGVHIAIEVAEKTGLPLIIAAKYEPTINKDYFEKLIKPKLSEKIQWIGEVDAETRNELFSKALVSLHPVTWPEPFGLTLAEAMACGCPVIAFNQGSIPEVIWNEKTGFVVSNAQEMVTAVGKIETISRDFCRMYSRSAFNAKRMTDRYEEQYLKLVQEKQTHAFHTLTTWSEWGRIPLNTSSLRKN